MSKQLYIYKPDTQGQKPVVLCAIAPDATQGHYTGQFIPYYSMSYASGQQAWCSIQGPYETAYSLDLSKYYSGLTGQLSVVYKYLTIEKAISPYTDEPMTTSGGHATYFVVRAQQLIDAGIEGVLSIVPDNEVDSYSRFALFVYVAACYKDPQVQRSARELHWLQFTVDDRDARGYWSSTGISANQSVQLSGNTPYMFDFPYWSIIFAEGAQPPYMYLIGAGQAMQPIRKAGVDQTETKKVGAFVQFTGLPADCTSIQVRYLTQVDFPGSGNILDITATIARVNSEGQVMATFPLSARLTCVRDALGTVTVTGYIKINAQEVSFLEPWSWGGPAGRIDVETYRYPIGSQFMQQFTQDEQLALRYYDTRRQASFYAEEETGHGEAEIYIGIDIFIALKQGILEARFIPDTCTVSIVGVGGIGFSVESLVVQLSSEQSSTG